MTSTQQQPTRSDQVMVRIARQVDKLIMPDFRPLSKLLHEHIRQTETERARIARLITQTRSEAMAAATELMLSRDAHWQQQSGNYFERLEDQRRRKK